ncbi:MAG: exodeoxyribonuclease VII small subunit [bacterium]
MAKKTFEDAMQRLEEIVRQLEEGSLSLEESLKVYEEGIKLSEFCSAKLDEAENKIKRLVKQGDEFNLSPGS